MIDRYTRPRMARIWESPNRFQKMLEIEILACEALSEAGVVPKSAVKNIKAKAKFDIKRISKIEEEVKHEILAFVSNVAENVGPDGRFIHYGLTSNDVLDTLLAIQMKEAGEIILDDLKGLIEAVREKAKSHKKTVMVGRTHGIHAEPITFAHKLLIWCDELKRSHKRLERAVETVSYGKVSGAVGNYAMVNPLVEDYVCQKLGLKVPLASNQVIQRDRHAEFVCCLAILGSSIDKMATEIRHLQRTEVLEAEEPFTRGQKGSSAMPHKKNPVTCEQLSGLARLLRSYAAAALENIPLWHERDISHSSVERVIIPDATILADYILDKMTFVIKNMMVYPERMLDNLNKTRGLIFSGRILLELTKKGLKRDEAYGLIQRSALQVWKGDKNFQDLLLDDPEVAKHLTKAEIVSCFNVDFYLRNTPRIYKKFNL